VSLDPAFPTGSTIIRDGLIETVRALDEGDGILNDHDYYWRVIPVDTYGASPTSNLVRKFLVRGSPGTPGAIMGKVTEAISHLAVSGASVKVIPVSTTAHTAPTGKYFVELEQGVYNLEVTAAGYEPRTVAGVVVTSGWYTTMDIALTATQVNHAPVLAAVGNKRIAAGMLLSFQVSATDVDAQQVLTLSAEGLPSGAVFVPATGAFTWTPTPADVRPEPYEVTFTVTDNGSPPLSDSKTINITVVEGAHIVGPNWVEVGSRVELAFYVEGMAPDWTYEWRKDGVLLVDQTTALLVIPFATLDDTGWYETTAWDNGKAKIEPVTARFHLEVVGDLPALGLLGLMALACMLPGLGVFAMRRR
jgi:hypothetical protein